MHILKNKVAIVVGGSGGLGASIVEGFIESGCDKVVIIDIKENKELYGDSKSKRKIKYVKCDISKPLSISYAFDKALTFLDGRLDILVNSAGIQRRERSDKFSPEMWREVMQINLDAVFYCMQFACKILVPQGYGKIINISSINGNFGGVTIPAYSASKGAVEQLTKSFCNDLAKYGININTISPGYFNTKLNDKLMNNSTRVNEIVNRIPQGRMGNPQDIKGISIFLASSASDYINGACITIDGGYSGR